MTREEARAAIKVMEAYANGKKIQGTDLDGNWFDCENPNFDWASFNYRIKPEPKYRPFRTQEECWNEMHKHSDFGWLYYKEKGYYVSIDAMGDRVGMNGQKFVEAFSDYTFTDGEPFGITREESKEG